MAFIDRSIVDVDSYFAVCHKERGELFLKAISADYRYSNTSIIYKKKMEVG